MVDTVTTKGITVSAATVARQGYWRGVFRRLLRDPGGVFVGAIILILLALALFGGVIAVPLIVGGAAGLDTAQKALLVACGLFVSGLATASRMTRKTSSASSHQR